MNPFVARLKSQEQEVSVPMGFATPLQVWSCLASATAHACVRFDESTLFQTPHAVLPCACMQLYPQLLPGRAYSLTPIKDAQPQAAPRSGLFARRRQLACDLDELAKGLDTVKLLSAAKQQQQGSGDDDAMMLAASPR